MSLATTSGEQRVLLRSISWQTYETLVGNPDRTGRLITYDRGVLEIMSPSMAHELDRSLLGRYDGEKLWIRRIDGDGYKTISASEVLQGFPVVDAVATLNSVGSVSETELVRRFVAKLSS